MRPTSARRSARRSVASAASSAARERRPARVAALHLQRQEALQRELPGEAKLVAEAGERLRRHRVRPRVVGDEARRGRHQRELADPARLRERPVEGDHAAERPAHHRERLGLVRERAGERRDGRVDRPRLDGVAVAVAGQVDDVNAMPRGERGQERREQSPVQREAVQQHERTPLPHRLDVKTGGAGAPRRRPRRGRHRFASASAASRASTSPSACAAEKEMRSRAVPGGTVGGRIAGT